jgi:hypothetical protein
MTPTEKTMIDQLFARLSQAESKARDANDLPDQEVVAHIGDSLKVSPNAPYYMAQTLVVQEQALQTMAERVERLEQALAQAQSAPAQGGFFASLFGQKPAPRPAPQPRSTQAEARQAAFQQAPQGSFLAGAMQTAVGVAGGMMVASALSSAFAGDANAAAPQDVPPESDPMAEEPRADEGGFDDLGADEERFGGGFDDFGGGFE